MSFLSGDEEMDEPVRAGKSRIDKKARRIDKDGLAPGGFAALHRRFGSGRLGRRGV
jgi:hypothetical protein